MTAVKNLQAKLLMKFSVDALAYITSDENMFYLSGVYTNDGFMLVSCKKALLFVDFRYIEIARKNAYDFIEVVEIKKKRTDIINEFIRNNSIKKVVIEDDNLTVSDFEKIKESVLNVDFLNLGDIVSRFRYSKSEAEIEKIKNAQLITDNAFSEILNFIKPGVSEKEIAARLEFIMKKNGADDFAFPTICVSGKNSSMPHGVPSDKIIENGDFLTLDFGAKKDYYCSDMTRTVCIGRATDEMKKVYGIVLEAQKMALDAIHSGINGNEIDAIAREFIYSSGYKGCFGHSLGHSLGIEIHEMPCFSPNYTKAIPENAVISVEPGIYIENKFGIRIEDIVLVTKNGCVNLTKSQKGLMEL